LLRRSSDLPGGFPPSRRTGIGTRVSAPSQHASAARVWPSDSLPIWSCSVWGLPCHRLYRRRGALLPHLFTLTPVCSLWHWPSLSLDAQIPDVIRHTALRSSDFPLPKRASASAATARLTCNVYANPSCAVCIDVCAAATIAIRGPHRAELSQLISAKVFALLSSRGHVLHFSPGTSFTLLARF
jgi:hypothetical protein